MQQKEWLQLHIISSLTCVANSPCWFIDFIIISSLCMTTINKETILDSFWKKKKKIINIETIIENRQPCRSCLQRSEFHEIHPGIASNTSCPILEGKPVQHIFQEIYSNVKKKSEVCKQLLTSKLICPPMEKVKFKWANFSRSTDTILGRMSWTWLSSQTHFVRDEESVNSYFNSYGWRCYHYFCLFFRNYFVHKIIYLVILFELISFFLAAVSPNWRYIKHPTSEFNKCSSKIKTNTH